jgi:hypothetical protein
MAAETEAPDVEPVPAPPEASAEPEPEPDDVPRSRKEAIQLTKDAASSGHPIEVVESFSTLIRGQQVDYRKGELVHPDDPAFSKNPHLFRPVVYPHPVGKRGTLSTPEVRS